MSEPKVPIWMNSEHTLLDGRRVWRFLAKLDVRVRYTEGDSEAFINDELTAENLRELADLIDSCQAPSHD